MAWLARNLTLSTTAQPILVQGVGTGTGTTFPNVSGAVTDPLPFVIRNTDAAITIYLGGPTVTSAGVNGYPLKAGESMPWSILNSDIPYAVAASGTPVLSVLAGRQ